MIEILKYMVKVATIDKSYLLITDLHNASLKIY